jgi:type IV pilus assembly protein PilA
MFARLLAAREKEEGFTLIELLVVIIIIGILAAIAIPVFLNQRAKGWDSAVKADLRNAATAQETWLTDTGVYNDNSPVSDATVAADADPVELGDVGFKYSTASNYADSVAEITVVADTNQSYTLSAVSASGNCFEYSSPDGLKEVDCA